MGLTATAVEIPGGEMGDLVAEHLEEDRGRRHRKFHRQTDHATIALGCSAHYFGRWTSTCWAAGARVAASLDSLSVL